MKVTFIHPVYGEVLYCESYWTGKKTLVFNGVAAEAVSKKEFVIGDRCAILNGSALTGVTLQIDGETLQLFPKPKWYEILLAVIPFIFITTWGNNSVLCSILPIIGGAIGGALGGAGTIVSLLLMRKAKKVISKILIGIAATLVTVFIAFLIAVIYLAFLFVLS